MTVDLWQKALSAGYFEKHLGYEAPTRPPELDEVSGDALEIGVGIGRIAATFPEDVRLVGVDVASDYFGSDWLRHRELHVVDGSGDLSVFEDEAFDWVYSFAVFQHLTFHQVARYVDETRRILRPGGRFAHYFGPAEGDHDRVRIGKVVDLDEPRNRFDRETSLGLFDGWSSSAAVSLSRSPRTNLLVYWILGGKDP